MKQESYTLTDGCRNFYEVVGVRPDCSFSALKKAYFRRAKGCHPDLHPDAPDSSREFRLLVSAFDVLSDPDKRRRYDCHLGELGAAPEAAPLPFAVHADQPIMDSFADDILEELIVDNTIPLDTSLQTLLLDLANTEQFLRFREGKHYLNRDQYPEALAIFRRCCEQSPNNILYHFYYGCTAENLKRWALAEKQFHRCVRLGERRYPPLRLDRIRRSLHRIRERHRGFFGRLRNWLTTAPPPSAISTEQQMIAETSRAMTRLLADQHRRETRLRAEKKKPRQLPPKS